jgi:hypothetical protein
LQVPWPQSRHMAGKHLVSRACPPSYSPAVLMTSFGSTAHFTANSPSTQTSTP